MNKDDFIKRFKSLTGKEIKESTRLNITYGELIEVGVKAYQQGLKDGKK